MDNRSGLYANIQDLENGILNYQNMETIPFSTKFSAKFSGRIWQISDAAGLSVQEMPEGNPSISVQNLAPSDAEKIQLNASELNLILIQSNQKGAESILLNLARITTISNIIRIVVVPDKECTSMTASIESSGEGNARAYVFADSIGSNQLSFLMNLLFQVDYYRHLAHGFTQDLKQYSQVFDSMLDMSRRELKGLSGESKAYQSLLDFEGQHREFCVRMQDAMHHVAEFQDRELKMLQTHLVASERLNEFRDFEMKEMKAQFFAAESALDFSRRERIEKEEVIDALERLRNYSEGELENLIRENATLRKQLGISKAKDNH